MTNKQNNQTNNGAPHGTKFIVVITIKLLLICTVTALLLAGVNSLTVDRIADNIAAEKAAAIKEIFPDATRNEPVTDITVENVNELYLVYSGDTMLGYAASVAPLGFGGALDMMVGVNTDGAVAGIKLIAHSETPGLGSRAGEDWYLSGYTGQTAATVTEVDTITGATFSSSGIRTGAAQALAAYSAIYSSSDVIPDGGAK